MTKKLSFFHYHDNIFVFSFQSAPSPYVDAANFVNSDSRKVIIPMDMSLFLNNLLFKSASQPGLARVLMKIFDMEGVAVRRKKACNLRGGPNNEYGYVIGKTYEEATMEYDDVTFIGLVRPSLDDVLHEELGLGLCPDPSILVEENDLLVMISATTVPSHSSKVQELKRGYIEEAKRHHEKLQKEDTRQWKNVLVCGWRPVWDTDPMRLKTRIMDVAVSMLPGSSILFLNHVDVDEFESIMQEMSIYPSKSRDPHDNFNSEDSLDSRLYELPEDLFALSKDVLKTKLIS